MSFVPYRPERLSAEESLVRAQAIFERLEGRRSVREFSSDPVSRELIELAIRAASTAPSGAHMQPWTFAAISSAELKAKIRVAAEAEEKESYERRMSDEWRQALAHLGTDWRKPYLELVPWIVVLFVQRYAPAPEGGKTKHYYVTESCGIAAGMFIAALHEMGLATLTHTPSPMRFLSELLGRPLHETPLILFPIGYPAPEALVPDLKRKALDEVSVWYE